MINCKSAPWRGGICLLALLLAGCLSTPPRSTPVNNPVQASEAVSRIDREMDQLAKDIQVTRDEINKMTIEDFEVKKQLSDSINFPYSTDYMMTGGQNPGDPNTGRVVRITNDLAQGRKVLEQQREKMKNLRIQKQSLQQQSMGCFPAETLVVMADGTTRPFAEVRIGDLVQTYDIGYEKTVPRKVVDVYQVDGNHLYLINGELRTSGGERLLSQDGWRPVRDLKVGDSIHVAGRMLKIERIDLTPENRRLFNMQVADTHNFYVAVPEQGAILVHNSGGGGGGGGGGK